MWQCGGNDVFFNSKVRKDVEICDGYVVAYDSGGYKHYYNREGEYLTEYYPQYAMPK